MSTHCVRAAAAALLVLLGGAVPAAAQQSPAEAAPPAQPPPEQTPSPAPPPAPAPADDSKATPPAPAAPTAADIERAKSHYIAATRALGNGEFIFAAKEFFAAYEITKDPILFFKIGLAHDMAGDCGSASIFYRRYLAEAQPTGEEKVDAEKRLADCDAQLGPPPGAAEPTTGPGITEPKPLFEPLPEDDGAAVDPAPVDPVEEDSDLYRPSVGAASPLETAAYVTLGGAVAAATAAAVLSISANAKQEDLENLVALPSDGVRTPFEGNTREQYDKLIDDGERLQTMAYVAWGVAGAAATTAIILFLVDGDDSEESGAAALIVPTASPDGSVGFTSRWEF